MENQEKEINPNKCSKCWRAATLWNVKGEPFCWKHATAQTRLRRISEDRQQRKITSGIAEELQLKN